MFIAIRDKNNKFYKDYLNSFTARSACTSTLFETIDKDMNEFKTAIGINGLTAAFNDLLFHNEELKLSPFDLPSIVSKITNTEITKYRTTEARINGKSTVLDDAKNIIPDLYILFQNYYQIWSYLDDPFLRESMFHIRFLKIHPFEDGNGRTARLITAYNLIKSNIPPVIVPQNKKTEYCRYIELDDYEGLANMFRDLSQKEVIVMESIYNAYKQSL